MSAARSLQNIKMTTIMPEDALPPEYPYLVGGLFYLKCQFEGDRVRRVLVELVEPHAPRDCYCGGKVKILYVEPPFAGHEIAPVTVPGFAWLRLYDRRFTSWRNIPNYPRIPDWTPEIETEFVEAVRNRSATLYLLNMKRIEKGVHIARLAVTNSVQGEVCTHLVCELAAFWFHTEYEGDTKVGKPEVLGAVSLAMPGDRARGVEEEQFFRVPGVLIEDMEPEDPDDVEELHLEDPFIYHKNNLALLSELEGVVLWPLDEESEPNV